MAAVGCDSSRNRIPNSSDDSDAHVTIPAGGVEVGIQLSSE